MDGGWKRAMALILALTLALRIVAAPMIMAAPAPGLMAICTGGQIVYVSMEDGQPVGEDAPSISCPFFSITSVVALAELSIKPPQALVVVELSAAITDVAPVGAARAADNQSRAPPLLS